MLWKPLTGPEGGCGDGGTHWCVVAGEVYELRGLGPGCRDTPGAQILAHSG